MKQSECCTLSVRLTLESTTLLGGDYEFEPYFASQATFGTYRIQQRGQLRALSTNAQGPAPQMVNEQTKIQHDGQTRHYESDQLREFALPALHEMRGSEAIRFRLFVRTRYSGQPELDRSDSLAVKREMAAGAVSLSVADLFQLYLKLQQSGQLEHNQEANEASFMVSEKFYDDKLLEYKLRTMMEKHGQQSQQEFQRLYQKCLELTHKAVGYFEIRVRNFNFTQFQKSLLSEQSLDTRLYAHSPVVDKKLSQWAPSSGSSKGYEPLLYNSRKTWAFMGEAMEAVVADYVRYFVKLEISARPLVNASCQAVLNLHLPEYRSSVGRMPVYAFVTCGEPFFREYASEAQKRNDLNTYGFRAKTEDFFLMMIHSSLRRHGLSEEAFIEAVEWHFDVDNRSEHLEIAFLLAEEVMADVGTFCANMAYYTSDVRFMTTRESLEKRKKKDLIYQMITLDSWDSFILNGTSMCDDCDGQAKVAIAVLDAFYVGRVDRHFEWASPLLQAAQTLRRFTVSQLVGATVSSAYVKTDNAEADKQDAELCMVGDATDLKAHNDGHCFILDQPLTHTIEMARAGNVDADVVQRMVEANNHSDENVAFAKRDAKRQLLVLEGTGSVDPRQLPLQESYADQPALLVKKRAEKQFMKHMRLRLKQQPKLAEMFVGEGLVHYSEKQDPRRRISAFYNHVVMGVSGVLKQRFDLSLAQFAYCNKKQNGYTYGVTMGELARNMGAFICPFKESRQEWQQSVIPTVEATQNEMPISAFGRYTDAEYDTQIFSRCVMLRDLKADFDYMTYVETVEALEARHAFEELASTVWEDDSLFMVRLYSRCWKMSAAEELATFLEASPDLVTYACFVEKHLPVCEPTLEITCIVRRK